MAIIPHRIHLSRGKHRFLDTTIVGFPHIEQYQTILIKHRSNLLQIMSDPTRKRVQSPLPIRTMYACSIQLIYQTFYDAYHNLILFTSNSVILWF